MNTNTSNYLYVIVPYFNFINYKSGQINLDRFINNIKNQPLVRVVLVEGSHGECLPDYSGLVYKHIKVNLPNILWVKENLINIGFKNLPTDWQYGGWFDRDIEFFNPTWSEETINALQKYDLMQPWTQCLYLNSKFEHAIIDRFPFAESFCSLFSKNLLTDKNLFTDKHTQPGQAWCINKNFYNHLGGLYEHAILGGAEFLWIPGKLNIQKSHHRVKGIDDNIKEYLEKIKNANICAVNGMICHYYHGDMKNRQYIKRYEILNKHNFDPKTFLTHNLEGVLTYTELGKQMEEDVKSYFISRLEDNPHEDNNFKLG
jgi:hypothetical protein